MKKLKSHLMEDDSMMSTDNKPWLTCQSWFDKYVLSPSMGCDSHVMFVVEKCLPVEPHYAL